MLLLCAEEFGTLLVCERTALELTLAAHARIIYQTTLWERQRFRDSIVFINHDDKHCLTYVVIYISLASKGESYPRVIFSTAQSGCKDRQSCAR